jgi:hypothetical protein
MNRSGRVLRRVDSGAPIHEAGIALYRTVMIDREAIRQRGRLFGSKPGQPVISVDTKKLHAAADEIGCKRRQIAAGRAAMDAPG